MIMFSVYNTSLVKTFIFVIKIILDMCVVYSHIHTGVYVCVFYCSFSFVTGSLIEARACHIFCLCWQAPSILLSCYLPLCTEAVCTGQLFVWVLGSLNMGPYACIPIIHIHFQSPVKTFRQNHINVIFTYSYFYQDWKQDISLFSYTLKKANQ